ncbi:hypothetical protein L5515_004332 [Caenorhabditis briggsae]|uniref:BRCT domain-containing protein n=1 Tax=Caenorhabditis briggsae TaxID=6238 RepID=A0AAE9JAY3_CAEBR|nr:hypothetical protein L5515_004332 [Caenorhabditis briggsae]
MRFPQLSTLFLLILGSGQNALGAEANSLKLLYDDLSILSRVTNAIALESAALQKSVKVRDVITELLQVHNGNFSELMKIDPSFLIETLDGLFETRKQIMGSIGQTISIEELNKLKDFAEMLVDLTADKFNYEKDLNSKDIVEKAMANTTTMVTCDKDLLTNLSDFSNFMQGNTKGGTADLAIIKKIKSSKQEIENCVQTVSGYKETINRTTTDLSSIVGMKEILDLVLELSKPNAVMTLSTRLNKFQKIFLEILSVVKNREKTKVARMIEKTSKALKNSLIHDHTHHSHHYHLTAGFPEKEDMSRVTDDLKSDWFKQKISMGKSTKDLEAALVPFSQFADKMKVVERNWSFFQNGFVKAEKKLSSIAKKLNFVENYDYEKMDPQFFKDTETFFTDCFKRFKGHPYDADITSFKSGYSTLNSFIESMEAISVLSVEMTDLIFTSSALSIFLDEFEEVETDKKSSSDLRDEINELTNWDTAEQVFKMFQRLKMLQDTYLRFRKESNSVNISIQNIGISSGIYETSSCLRNYKFDANRLNITVVYMEKITDLLENDTYHVLKNVLSEFAELRIALLDTEKFVKGIASRRQRDVSKQKSPLLKLKDSVKLSNHLGNGMRILKEMIEALKLQDTLLDSTNYGETVNSVIKSKNPAQHVQQFWEGSSSKIRKMINDLKILDSSAAKYQKQDLVEIGKIFDNAAKVQGIPEVFPYISEQLEHMNTDYQIAFQNSEKLKHLDLEFSSHKGELSAALLSLDPIKEFFDDLFGLSPNNSIVTINQSSSPTLIIIVCISVLLVLVIGALVAYGFTSSGRKSYRRLYIYYFGKQQDYEKRWRYSLFLDRSDGKNVLIDAVREINSVNLLNAVKRGAYVNVCNKFGNTSLHVATRRGYSDLVEILIKNGADRTFLNAQNKTPEQMIPENYQTTEPEKIYRYVKIEQIYNKYRNRKFKQRVPMELPTSSFHIFIDLRTDDRITNEFTACFQSITSDEVMPTTTHCIIKTGENEMLETDDMNILAWIFSGIIIVKDAWMTECIRDKKLISKDSNFLVEKVKYSGTVYDTVIQWSNAMAKGTIPYLYGVHVVIVMKECPNLLTLASIVIIQGGVVLDTFPEKGSYNKGSHPYHHKNHGPIFILHDGNTDLSFYKNDPDKMFSLFTEKEFLMFMLKRETNIDTRSKLLPILVEGDD